MSRSHSLENIVERSTELMRALRYLMFCEAKDGAPTNFLQLHALAVIGNHPSLSMKEFADIILITAPSATIFIKRLEHLGLVRRAKDVKNRKVVRLTLTTSGKRVLKDEKARRGALYRSLLGKLTDNELQSFAVVLEKLQHSCASLSSH